MQFIRNLIPTLLGLIAAAVGIPEEGRDIAIWAGSAAALAPVVGATVSHLRRHALPKLDGITVPLFSVGVGSGYGAALGWGTELIPGGLVEWLTLGATAGLMASYGVDLSRSLLKLNAAPKNAVLDFIVGIVKSAVPAPKLPAALTAVAPILAQFAQSELVLTDDLRSSLQGRVLTALRRAGLVGVDL